MGGDDGGVGGDGGDAGGVNMQMHFLLEEHEAELSPLKRKRAWDHFSDQTQPGG